MAILALHAIQIVISAVVVPLNAPLALQVCTLILLRVVVLSLAPIISMEMTRHRSVWLVFRLVVSAIMYIYA